MIPGEPLIYEQDDKGRVYARYRDRSEIKRWLIGDGTPLEPLFGFTVWKEMIELSEKNPMLRKRLEQVLDLYYLLKEPKK